MTRDFKPTVELAAMEIYAASAAPTADAGALYARDLLLCGEFDAAADIVMPALIQGYASPAMQLVAAGLYYSATEKKGRGRRAKQRPYKWMEVGTRFLELREQQKCTWEQAILKLMDEFPRGKTAIEDAVRFFLDVQEKVDEFIANGGPVSPR